MATAVRLHVTSEILAVSATNADHRFVNIPAGSVIETSDDPCRTWIPSRNVQQ